jgi:PilZ domain
MLEQRKHVRFLTVKSGRLLWNGGQSDLDAVILNLSDTGASVRVSSTVEIPDEVYFTIESGHTVRCRVAWRTRYRLGLSFE